MGGEDYKPYQVFNKKKVFFEVSFKGVMILYLTGLIRVELFVPIRRGMVEIHTLKKELLHSLVFILIDQDITQPVPMKMVTVKMGNMVNKEERILLLLSGNFGEQQVSKKAVLMFGCNSYRGSMR